jgi:DNA repair exonuclease SbcCD nuclease subunit
MRGDNIHFHNHYKKFYTEVFFPYLEENGIDVVFQLGDLFDRRKYISFQTLALCRKYFFDILAEKNIKFYTLLGNHDIAFKNTLEVNSPQLLLKDYKNIVIYDKPTAFENIDVIPWICQENEEEVSKYIESSNNQICFGHFEIAGFEMDRGNVCHDGMDRNILSKYETVLSGHFHHKSSDGQIVYVGTPGEMTWADYDDKRGFHIFDTETRDLDFIENPFKIFHKIVYDDRQETLESLSKKKYDIYKNTIVKVIVANKTNALLYDMFFDNLYKVSPLDITIVENFTDYSEVSENDIVDQSDDTTTILDKYIDGLEIDLDKSKLKNVMREIYLQAQNFETA